MTRPVAPSPAVGRFQYPHCSLLDVWRREAALIARRQMRALATDQRGRA